MHRRELIIGSACLAAAGAAYALTPRRRLSLLGNRRLSELTPRQVGDWSSRDVSGLSPPNTADSLVAALYDEVVERAYRLQSAGDEIMMLLAHGASQTNELQLHRPEVCYPSFGFQLMDNRPLALQIAPGVVLPARQFLASASGQQEGVVYWTRIGDSLPTSAGEQRAARLQSAIEGFVCDGVLARFSTAATDLARADTILERFVPDFLYAVGANARSAFIGVELAARMAGKGP